MTGLGARLLGNARERTPAARDPVDIEGWGYEASHGSATALAER
jgi:hypothetical protein